VKKQAWRAKDVWREQRKDEGKIRVSRVKTWRWERNISGAERRFRTQYWKDEHHSKWIHRITILELPLPQVSRTCSYWTTVYCSSFRELHCRRSHSYTPFIINTVTYSGVLFTMELYCTTSSGYRSTCTPQWHLGV
jgi:hypothetical protein